MKFREIINSIMQKKNLIMVLTTMIYSIGLFSYFYNFGILTAGILLILAIIAILKDYISPKLVLFWYFIFLFAFINATIRIKDSDALYEIAPQKGTIEGQVVSIPERTPQRTRFFFKVSKINYNGKFQNITGKTYVSIYADEKLDIGDYCDIEGKLKPPFKVGNPSQFDFGKYLRNFDTFTTFSSEGNVQKINEKLGFKWKFLQSLNRLRNRILNEQSRFIKSPNIEILGGIVFGDDAVTPPDYIKSAFANSGILHILAASGMNVAIIYGAWYWILKKLRVPFTISVISGIFVIIFYSMMTGLGASVVRAMLMLIFILIGKLFDRDADSISLLSFVGLLMLIVNPADINNVSFQLSFLATFGLLTTAPAIFSKVNKLPNWLSGTIFIPLVAQIWVAPIQMFYFNTFSLYSVLVNILVVPVVSIVSFGGFASAVLAIFPQIAPTVCSFFAKILNPLLNYVVFVPELFAKIPHALLITTKPTILQLIIYYILVVAITLLAKYGKGKKFTTISIIMFCILILSSVNIPNHNFETIAFDVQNADAFLIKTPQNKYFMIDSAKSGYHGSKSTAQAVILEYLRDKGITELEGFIITHFDNDHSGGAIDIMKNIKVKHLYLNSYNEHSNTSKNIFSYLKHHKNITIEIPKSEEIIYKENNNFKIKAYKCNFKGRHTDNDNSIITLVSDGNFDELFMADAGLKAFHKIQNLLPNNIEVLKIGHHGAKNVADKNMLKRINPTFTIVSTGQNNYGHPNPYTMYILEHNCKKVFRTDYDNSIKIVEKENNYQAFEFSNEKYKYIQASQIYLGK